MTTNPNNRCIETKRALAKARLKAQTNPNNRCIETSIILYNNNILYNDEPKQSLYWNPISEICTSGRVWTNPNNRCIETTLAQIPFEFEQGRTQTIVVLKLFNSNLRYIKNYWRTQTIVVLKLLYPLVYILELY